MGKECVTIVINDIRNYKWFIITGLIAVLLTIPFWASNYTVSIFLLIFMYLALAQMWNLLAGYAGLVSLGQQMFIGLGGYTLAVLTELYRAPLWSSILIGGVISLIFALIISAPIFRMREAYFTIGTWLVAEALKIFFSNWGYVRYGQGFFITAAYQLTTTHMYYMAMVIGLGSVAVVYIILRSRLGLGLMAIRDNETAAESMGVEVFKAKLICFLIGAFVTSIAGSIFYLYQVFIQPYAAFGIDWTVAMVFIVIIGGIGTIEGPLAGVVIYVLLRQYLYNYAGISMLVLGLIAIVLIHVAPKGFIGTLQEKLGFEFLSPRRR
ncbi:branched-chain amino acid ABC transporter permease [Moorella sulfitireducens]|uniref:branched-chain amino acid ABC transporter permease n=1 Tax=Neomoorella sulfitireducens TaxID=2972948 RepID=UPI0021AC3FE7|nr:branched-chain amino acid ABC transporter permease [Moorella sulfitireducens]